MRVFVEFYHESTGWNGVDFSGPVKLIPKCGSDSVAIMDGRWSRSTMVRKAREIAKQRKLPAFRLCAGARFDNAKPLTEVVLT